MKLISDPAIAVKIRKMKERVRWREMPLLQRNIDQTRFVIDDEAESAAFSFLVIGDSGAGPQYGCHPQRRLAEEMVSHVDESRFLLHTGDVVYLVGSSEYYTKNFIEPYRELIVGGERYRQIPYDRMVFKFPFLPVLGNHDYYDLPLAYGVLAQLTLPLRRLLKSKLELDVGLRGSVQGNAFARAFIDYLKDLSNRQELEKHLDQHYTAVIETGRCLLYQSSQFTRIPNRYYMFRYGGVDFFALDTNTFNAPIPLPKTPEGEAYRTMLEQRSQDVEREKQQIIATIAGLDLAQTDNAAQVNDLRTKLEQLNEIDIDIDKQLAASGVTPVDNEQLNWLQQRLIASWNDPKVRGRVIFMHHPPYVTEATKWNQAQTLAIRSQLQKVFDGVAAALKGDRGNRPIADLVLTGHAHCLEHLQTLNTGHADANMHWIICGASGYGVRRQRPEGVELMQIVDGENRIVARSLLYVGRKGHGAEKRRPYSFLRIDVQDTNPAQFVVRPFVSEFIQGEWVNSQLESFTI